MSKLVGTTDKPPVRYFTVGAKTIFPANSESDLLDLTDWWRGIGFEAHPIIMCVGTTVRFPSPLERIATLEAEVKRLSAELEQARDAAKALVAVAQGSGSPAGGPWPDDERADTPVDERP